MNEIIPAYPTGSGLPIASGPDVSRWERLAAAFLASAANPKTRRARSGDLADFAAWLGLPIGPAIAALMGQGPGPANQGGLAYRVALVDRGLAPSSVNRRLASLRGLVALARTWGWANWSLDVANLPAAQYRDTTGPGAAGWDRMLALAEADTDGGDPRALRDLALLRLLFDMGLRRGEALGLDVADLDLTGGRIAILGKHRTQSEWLTVPEPTRQALEDWLRARGPVAGPVFVRLDPTATGRGRLSGESVRRIVRALGERVGLARPVRPHGLRHASITAVLDANGGDVRAAARFSRHKDLRTLAHYDDCRRDLGGAMARLIARPSRRSRSGPE